MDRRHRIAQQVRAWAASGPTRALSIALSAIAGTLSLLVTGHISGINNNLFNYVILGRLYDLPQFLGDVPVQSMRYYASGFWLPFAGAARWISPDSFFLIWAWIARIALCGALLLWADLLGIRATGRRAAFLAIILLSRYMMGFAFAGDGDLLTTYFSHSDLANATMLVALYLAARGRLASACLANGVTFFINAFMAIWTAIPFALLLVANLRSRRLSAREAGQRMAIGLAGFALLALPVLRLTFANPESAGQARFAYGPYLLAYFPGHFLVRGIAVSQILSLCELAVAGAVAAWSVRARSTAPLLALAGFAILWLVGAPLPYLVDTPGVYVLHLLRSSVGIHLFAMIAVAALAIDLWDRGTARGSLAAVALFAACIWPANGPLLLAIVTVATVTVDRWPDHALLRTIALLLLLATGAKATILTAHRWQANARIRDRRQDWRDIADWVRTHTPPTASFLLPTAPIYQGRYSLPAADPGEQDATIGNEGFEYTAQRRVWIDYKRGGVIMWAPSYYPLWRARVTAVLALPDVAARVAFARSNHIDFVADRCVTGLVPAARARAVCLYKGAD